MRTKNKFWCLTLLAALLVSSAPTNSRPQRQSPLKESAMITGVKVGQISMHTIVRVNGNGRLIFNVERLSNSDRLVLDFKNARLGLAQGSVSSALTPIRGIRVGQFRPDVARVVLDLEAVVPYSIKAEEQSITITFAPASTVPAATVPNQAALPKRENATAKTRREVVSPLKPEAALNSAGARPSGLSAQPIAAGANLGLSAIDAATGCDNGPPRNSIYSTPVQQHGSGIYGLSTSSAQALTAIAPTDPTSYVLGPDDQIAVRALDVEEMDGKLARVDLRGYIDVPLLGNIKAAGLSVEQLEAQLTEMLRKYVQEPRVTVTVSEYRSQPVSVLGAVNSPGVYNLTGRNTLVQLLSKAGGLRNDAGNTINITRGRAWGVIPLSSAKRDPSDEFSTAEVSLKSLLDAKNPQDNIIVKPTDVISVPRADLVYIVGAVRRPGGFVLNERDNMTVLQALSRAEGLEKTSAPKHAKIIRAGTTSARVEIPVNLAKILSGKSPDVPLLANDILIVPTSGAKSAAYRSIEAAIQVGTGVAVYRP